MKHPGDPTPRSVREVLADPRYEMVVAEQSSQIGGLVTNVLVVKHCGTETYWRTTYPAHHRESRVHWQQVEPVVEPRTTYRAVP